MNAPMRLEHIARQAELTDQHDCARIGDFVAEHGGSLFHLPAWLHAVDRGTGKRAGGFVTEHLGVMTGWLPLTEVRSLLFGKALVSTGFGVGGGILATSDAAARALAQAAEDYALRCGFVSIELRDGSVPQGWTAVSDKHCGFERVLAADDEAELLAIPRKARAEVRKGIANGLEICIGRGPEDLRMHYALYAESVRNLGTPVFPKSLFRSMIASFEDDSDILTVLADGHPLASVLSFYHDGAVMPFWGGGSVAARGARANERMYYELMLHARRRGMTRFDFGRSKNGSGPFAFKKNWGFEPQPLTYATWTVPGEAARDVDPTSAAYARKIALWKRLPLPVANTLGPLIARDLA